MEWKKVKLGEIADVQTGPFGSQLHSEDYVDKGSPIVTVEHLGNKRFTTQNLPFVSESDKARLSKYVMREGDIIFSRVGSVDRCSYAYKENEGWLFSGRCLRVRVNNDFVPQFIYYCLRQKSIIDFVKSIAVGATMPSINTALLNSIPLSVPTSLSDQRRIASILSSLDAQIENNNRINANLEAQAQALFKSWFVDFEPWGGVMPKDWKEGKLGDIAEITMGQSPAGSTLNTEGNGSIFYQGCSDFGFRFPTVRVFSTDPTRYAKSNSVLFSVRAPVGAVNVALTPCAIGRGLASIRAKGKYQSYILYLIKSLNNQFDSFNGEGSVFGCINKKSLEGMQIVCPSTQVLTDFESKISCLDDKIRNNTETNARLAALRDTLLPKLMKGEIEL